MSNRKNFTGGTARRYATLAGRVDEAITRLESMTERQTFDWFHVQQVKELLKNALLEAEEQYLQWKHLRYPPGTQPKKAARVCAL